MMKFTAAFLFLICVAFSSNAQNTGDFRAAYNGAWEDANTWEKYDGTQWELTIEVPSLNSNVYIPNGMEVTVNERVACNDLHIHTAGHLSLGADTLEVWGQLNFYSSASFPVDNAIVPSGPDYLINSTSEGALIFKGATRTIVAPGSGGTSNALAGYNMVLALDEGATATIDDNFRVGNLDVLSGNFTVNADSLFAGSTTGLNDGKVFVGEHVVFNPPAKSIARTIDQPIASFTLDSLAILNVATSDLILAANHVFLKGTVVVEEALGTDIFLPSNGSITGAAAIGTYNNLILQGSTAKILSGNTVINGILTKTSADLQNPSSYTLVYGLDGGLKYKDASHIITDDFLFPATNGPAHLIIDNSTIYLHEDRTLQGGLSLNNGILNLSSRTLTFGANSPPINGDFSESNYIELDETASVRKMFSAPGSFYFPIGTSNKYTPANISVNSGDFSSNDYLGVTVKDEKYPYDNSLSLIERHWIINSSLGDLNFDGVFKYHSSDPRGNEASIMAYIYGQSREEPLSLCDATSKTLSFNNVSTDLSEFYITGSNKCNVIDDTIAVVEGDYCGSVDLDIIIGSVAQTGNPATNKYIWQKRFNYGDWADIAGATDKDYDPDEITVPGIYEFRRVVTNTSCFVPHMSNVFAFTLYPEVADFAIGAATIEEFCLTGTGFEIVGEQPTGGDGAFSYIWERSKNSGAYAIVGGDTKDFEETEELGPGTYAYKRGVVSSVCGVTYSDSVVVEVYEEVSNFNIVAEASFGEYCGIPSEVVLKSTSSGGPQGGDGTYSYLWERSTDGISYLEVGTSEVLHDTTIPDYGKYYYRRTVASFTCATKTSNAVTINIYPEIEDNTIGKEEEIYCAESSSFTIEGSEVSGGGNYPHVFRWEKSTDGVSFVNLNSDTKDYNEAELLPGDYYYRRIVNNGVCRDTSDVLSVKVLYPVTNNDVTEPLISEYCGVPEMITLEASIPEGGDGTYSYFWERSIDGGEFVSLGIDTKDLSDTDLTIPGEYEYRRIVVSGSCEASVSNTVQITLYPELSANAIAATEEYCNVATGVVLTGSAMSGGDGTYAYIWEREKDGEGFLEVGTDVHYEETSALSQGTYKYRRTVTSATCSSTSEVFTISVYPPVTGNTIVAPEIANYCGTSEGFVIDGAIPTGGSGDYVYRYERKYNEGAWEAIGGNTASLEEAPLSQPGTYQYRRIVGKGACEESISNIVTIQVSTPMEITGTVTETKDNEKTGAISIEVSGGTPPFSYTWSNAAFTPNIASLDGGEYTVEVVDAAGCKASATFVVSRILGLHDSPNIEFYQLYPNPVRETLYIEASFRKSLATKIYIVNMVGEVIKTVQTTPASNLKLEVNMHAYPGGIYFVKVEIDGKMETWKFIKQ